ncbi:MAG: ABC transporter substrate-binding protein [Treponema sp.]|jgi:NitT/TauT family transport system substrate-binding protein|nr:ABC transporter substrate-binding protein [Treponema sp.]
MKYLSRKIAATIVLVFTVTLLLECRPNKIEKITIYGLKGPSGVGMIRLFENPPQARGFELQLEALAQSDLMAAKFISGEAKFGILPPDKAAKIAASGKKIQIAAVTGTGMFSLISADPSVRGFDDLKGRSVEVAGQGTTPDYVFRKILLAKGILPDKQIIFGYSLAYPEIAQALITNRLSLALLPEPFATMALKGNDKLAVLGDIQEEWTHLNHNTGPYPTTVFVVDSDFAAANGNLVAIILDSLKSSLEWVTANPAAAGQLVEKHELGLRAAVVTAAIPKSNYVFIPADEARPAIEALLTAFLEFAPVSIGGVLPADDFYYSAK